ncbi:hypothetical protein MPV89_004459 [Vibrio vulnificus]|uniref:TRADD-N-associated membrane domain-containing protein n=1 Tax=Vibrio vulnificus TaxID=672 RepID=UPI0005F19C0F|nr:hypothetical protein [Vibrio vulnificus]WMO23911.1 hypothetical protein NI374_06580 [Vibrio parahaemolyticus]EHH2451570.1 hypothetical protein [Vibrio vulnificus]EIZ4670220.1 hypothetical protein [Vibrio vulnificus]HDY7694864.1 hypothetical protein [Vibrio vulnificus]HDY7809392.1 hypothetical protein [Vibrio vulnificus]
MIESTLISLIAALFTAISGALAASLARRRAEQEKLQQKRIEELAKSVTSEAEIAKARAVEEIAKRLPKEEQTPEQLKEAVSHSFRVGGDLIIHNDVSNQDLELVEDLVTGYHQQALSQAKVQFWFSVVAATVGFGFIIYSATSVNLDNLESLLKIVPGVVIDAVALLFFRQAEQTRERATALYDRLRADNQTRSARDLVESIDDVKIKSTVKAQIALHMAGLKPKEIDLHSIHTSTGEK